MDVEFVTCPLGNLIFSSFPSKRPETAKMINRTLSHPDIFSLASNFVEILSEESSVGTATGFTYKVDQDLYFITNWHVVAGWNPIDDVALSKNGRFPDTLSVRFYSEKTWQNPVFLQIELIDPDGKPTWFEHPKFGRDVDVVALPLYLPVGAKAFPINTIPTTEGYRVEIGHDVFIVGYPFGSKWGVLPIWKRGSLASEPLIDMDHRPYFFVDTACRPGMSGSPTIFKERRPTQVQYGDGRIETFFTGFLGVYSGREGVSEDESKMQLGRVWKRSVIDEILHSRKTGTHGREIG